MTFELLAAFIAAVSCAGMMHLLRRYVGDRLPKWSVAASAGLGLIATTIYLEYGWFDRVSAALPDGIQVVWHEEEVMALRPWTVLVPITTRFVAMDVTQIAQHPRNAELRMARVYNFGRWRPVNDGLMVFDCAQKRQILISAGVEITEDGQLQGAEWVTAPEDDGFQKAACTIS